MNFYLSYGTKESLPIKDLLNEIVNLLDIEYTERDSDYFGTYYNCTGLSFDKLDIYHNNTDLIQFPDDYNLVIDLSITEGRNKDRKSKYLFLKKAFNRIDGLELFKDKIVED